MLQLNDNFCAAASTFAKMIIAEQHVPENDRFLSSIKVGGVAGGDKFSVHGLFFKYPVDNQIVDGCWLYGGKSRDDNLAAKASNHDLIGLTQCFIQDTEKSFNFPLMALIDYQGYRLSVMTELPIRKDTLIYGSNNAGKTLHDDPDVHKKNLNNR